MGVGLDDFDRLTIQQAIVVVNHGLKTNRVMTPAEAKVRAGPESIAGWLVGVGRGPEIRF